MAYIQHRLLNNDEQCPYSSFYRLRAHFRQANKMVLVIIIAVSFCGAFFFHAKPANFSYRLASENSSLDASPAITQPLESPPAKINDDSGSLHKDPTLVFICLGNNSFTKYQKYILFSLKQARLIDPNLDIVVILNSGQPNFVYEKLQQLNVTHVFYEVLLVNNGQFIKDFHRSFFVQGSMEPDGNKMFVQYTTERLLALHAYMNMTQRWNVFHMESDNMLYMNLNDLMTRMQACDVHIALPKAAVHTAVASFIYVRNVHAIEHFIRYIIGIFRLGSTKARKLLNTDWINDMTIAGRYIDLHAASAEHSKRTGVFELPSQFKVDSCISTKSGKDPIIFDACVLGQYYGGRYSKPGIPYWEPSRLLDPRALKLVWKEIGGKKRVPIILDFRIVNIHVHSKVLALFSSSRKDQPTGIDLENKAIAAAKSIFL